MSRARVLGRAAMGAVLAGLAGEGAATAATPQAGPLAERPSTYSSLAIVVAVLIFITREYLEVRRRRVERAGKLSAIKTLLARNCELNNWTVKSLRAVLEQIQEDFKEADPPRYSIDMRRDGATYLKVQDAAGGCSSRPLPEVRRQAFEGQLLNVAELDASLLARLEPAVTMVAELEHVRESLVSYLLREDEGEAPHFEGFVEFALVALDDAFNSLDALYVACTAHEALVYHRQR
ncbi:MAG: hypothetical protein JWQ97_327 [Phenylobacterium sp.]|nr:hypothetical protein [Phenylobacterium sp.]